MRKLNAALLATAVTLSGAGIYTVAANAHDNNQSNHQYRMHQGNTGGQGDMEFGEAGEQEFEGRRNHRRGYGKRDGGHRGEGRRGRGHRGENSGREFGKRMFDRMDADNDGAVTLEEALAAGPGKMAGEGRKGRKGGKSHRRGRGGRDGHHMMQKLDTDKDGTITAAELDTWQAAQRQRVLDRMDFNGDGQIDKSDRDGKIEERFKKMDADSDGKVTREEVKTVMAEWRSERRSVMQKLRDKFWGGSSE